MPLESELLDPLSRWFQDEFGRGNRMLIHEEPRGRGGRRPDILVVFANRGHETVDEVTLIPVEIENSSRGAIHDPWNGLRQLRKYAGHAKYLAIPSTVAYRSTASEIPRRCEKWGVGLLVVDHKSSIVACEVEPEWTVPERSLRTYSVAMERWLSLRDSNDAFRRISGQRIVERVREAGR